MPTVTLSYFVACALNLDDHVLRAELELTVVPSRRGTLALSGSEQNIALVLDDLWSRSRPEAESGWDMTGPERRACGIAWPKAKAEIEGQGLRVEQVQYGRVILRAA